MFSFTAKSIRQHPGGKQRVLELLTKLKEQAKDHPEIQRIEAAIQHTETHFKEDKEPLY
jgi:hypothetical protein